MKTRILITGANGFIGKSLVELFDYKKYQIIAKSHEDLDLLDDHMVDLCFSNKFDYVIHCATIGGRRTKEDGPNVFYANTKMFENLIKHKARYKHMFVFGSGAELAEGDFPLNYYGLSKKYITQKIHKENLNCTVLRLWGCFGKHESEDRFIKSNIRRYIRKEDLIIHSHKMMDFFYVNDIVPVIEKLMKYPFPPTEVNLGYEETYTLYGISKIIDNLSNYKVDLIVEDKDKINPPYCNGTKSCRIEVSGLIGLERGIEQVYNELRNGR